MPKRKVMESSDSATKTSIEPKRVCQQLEEGVVKRHREVYQYRDNCNKKMNFLYINLISLEPLLLQGKYPFLIIY